MYYNEGRCATMPEFPEMKFPELEESEMKIGNRRRKRKNPLKASFRFHILWSP